MMRWTRSQSTTTNESANADDHERSADSRECHNTRWGSHAEFTLSLIGYTVGLGNIWRFPALAYKHGGAVFLIPYLALQMIIGIPIYFMQLCLGQYSGFGPVGLWKMVPAFQGVGVSMVIKSLIISIYYGVVMSYTVFYMASSTQTPIPWTYCTKEWLERGCYSKDSHELVPDCANATPVPCRCTKFVQFDFFMDYQCNPESGVHNTSYATLQTRAKTKKCQRIQRCTDSLQDPAFFYYRKRALQLSHSISDIGTPVWYLAYCLLLTWIIVCLCLLKGIRSSGKLVYLTVTFPYIIIVIILIEVLSRPGAMTGIMYYFVPKWRELLSLEVWAIAGDQVCFSLSLSVGGLSLLSSHNPYDYDILSESLLVVMLDTFTSVLSGMVVFSILGSAADRTNQSIDKVVSEDVGYGLAFATYPQTIGLFEPVFMWLILLFLMIFLLGLDSQFTLVETVVQFLSDKFATLARNRVLTCTLLCLVCFLLGLPLVCPGGTWLMHAIIQSTGYSTAFFVLFVELIGVHWIYSATRFIGDIEFMFGKPLFLKMYWRISWFVLSPICMLVLLVRSFRTTPEHAMPETWLIMLSWAISIAIVFPIPLMFCVIVGRAAGRTFSNKLLKALSPEADWDDHAHNQSPGSLIKIDPPSNYHFYGNSKSCILGRTFETKKAINNSVDDVRLSNHSKNQRDVPDVTVSRNESSHVNFVMKVSDSSDSHHDILQDFLSSEYHMTPDPLRRPSYLMTPDHRLAPGRRRSSACSQVDPQTLVNRPAIAVDTPNSCSPSSNSSTVECTVKRTRRDTRAGYLLDVVPKQPDVNCLASTLGSASEYNYDLGDRPCLSPAIRNTVSTDDKPAENNDTSPLAVCASLDERHKLAQDQHLEMLHSSPEVTRNAYKRLSIEKSMNKVEDIRLPESANDSEFFSAHQCRLTTDENVTRRNEAIFNVCDNDDSTSKSIGINLEATSSGIKPQCLSSTELSEKSARLLQRAPDKVTLCDTNDEGEKLRRTSDITHPTTIAWPVPQSNERSSGRKKISRVGERVGQVNSKNATEKLDISDSGNSANSEYRTLCAPEKRGILPIEHERLFSANQNIEDSSADDRLTDEVTLALRCSKTLLELLRNRSGTSTHSMASSGSSRGWQGINLSSDISMSKNRTRYDSKVSPLCNSYSHQDY